MNDYILDGHTPVVEDDVLAWGKWSRTADRTVKKDDVGDYFVSTVFLGLDHAFGGGEPLLFETMIFKKEDGKVNYRDVYCDRYSTWEEAEEGHKKALKFAKTL